MFDKEMYRETFSALHASEGTLEEVIKMTDKYRKSNRRARRASRIALIAAIIALALSAGAFAAYYFSLRDLEGPAYKLNGKEIPTLSLSNLKGTPEYEASQEWEGLLSAWFEQGENMVEPGYVSDEYSMYGAHSQEAKEALDALLDKYGLRMHEEPSYVRSLEELYSAKGVSGFMPGEGAPGDIPAGGPVYDDGSLAFNGSAALPGGGSVGYQFYSFAKGSFTRTGSILADADDFEEWTYTTSDGTDVLLAISGNKSILAADLDDCFIFVNVISGFSNTDSAGTSYGADTVSRSDLEAFADGFDFEAVNSLAE